MIHDKKLLIFDLDETLVHATLTPTDLQEDFRYGDYFVYKRPFLEDFLSSLATVFRLGIWSAADDTYVNDIVALIRPQNVHFEIVWGRSRCSKRQDDLFDMYYYEKRLRKLKKKGFTLEQILIIDDTPEKSRDNYGNAIQVQAFLGHPDDNELPELGQYLQTLLTADNVRILEKRFWKQQPVIAEEPQNPFNTDSIR